MMKQIVAALLIVSGHAVSAQAQNNSKLFTRLDKQAAEVEQHVIEWRRHFHQNPELSNREVKTGTYIAERLRSFGIEVTHPFAKTGVLGILKGSQPGPVVALRADIDALPVTERNGLAFASKEKAVFNGQETGVMHACGHDAHIAILLGAAEVFAKNRADIKGTIKFLFQPAEEGPPPGEEGAALLMIKEGALENPKVDVIFGLHIQSGIPVGTLAYRPGAFMASPAFFHITVKGKQAHGATPWDGVDPIVISSQIIGGLQTIISRQTELTRLPAVITVGSIHSGIRANIIPEEAVFEGTTRTFDLEMQKILHEKIELTARRIAESAGATVAVRFTRGAVPTYNDPTLTERMAPSLQQAVGPELVKVISPVMMGEDFAAYQERVPGLFFFLGGLSKDTKPGSIPVHHTPDFMIDESGFINGVKAFLHLTVDYMNMKKQ